jgi:hypothetical protein
VEGERAERVAGAAVTEVENLMVEVTVTGEEAADGEEVESQGVVLTMLEESRIRVKESGECLAVSMLLAEFLNCLHSVAGALEATHADCILRWLETVSQLYIYSIADHLLKLALP